jgi:dTDP-D-glucose 4,6-dehydratase
MVKRRTEYTGNEIMNWWLVPYHGKTIEEIFEANPEYKDDNRKFYQDYAVTQEQHDEWYELALDKLQKSLKWKRDMVKREFAMPYLNLAPSVKEPK